MFFFVYLLCCWKDKDSFNKQRPLYGHVIYCGYTNNIFRRLVEHITGSMYYGKNPYTKQFKGNIRLGYLEIFKTKSEAMKREAEFKKPFFISRDDKVKLIFDFKEKHPEVLEFIEEKIKKLL